MGDSLFSTCKTGENRVTASIMAVLRSLALAAAEAAGRRGRPAGRARRS